MLVLSRKEQQVLMIGDEIEIEVISIDGNRVKLAIKAPKQTRILRAEIKKRNNYDDRLDKLAQGPTRTGDLSECPG